MTETGRYNRINRGAALIVVLVVVTIVALLALGVAQLVVTHFESEEQLSGYTRAYYIGESGVNWQLNRMSRSELPGTTIIPDGRLAATSVMSSGYPGGFFTLSDVDSTTVLAGKVQVTLTGLTGATAPWRPPGDFYLTVVGQDAQTGIQRGLHFLGGGTGLSDRYDLYGINGIAFNSDAADPHGYCTLATGFISTNGPLTYNNVGQPPSSPPGFGGARLGPQASLSTGNWTGAWDLPRLPAAVRWPSIDEVVRFVWNGSSITQIQASNDNATQIQYLRADGTYAMFLSPIFKLTNAEFSYSDASQRTIKLSVAAPSTNNKNLFVFSDIQMGPNDVLVLDLHDTPNPVGNGTLPTSLRILIENQHLSATETSIKITNLTYTGQTTANSYLWFNDTDTPFVFSPTPGFGALHGLVYGINSLAGGGNQAGDIVINGSQAIPVTIDCLVGNHIHINGNVTLTGQPVEARKDPDRYILYYRILEGLQETSPTGDTSHSSYRQPVVGYGAFQ